MAKRMPSLCIGFFKSYKSASMSLFKISGASKDPYLFTVLPSLLTKNLDGEADTQAGCVGSNDNVEGVTAFIEKRKPNFPGE